MANGYDIIDSDKHFFIDPITRSITNGGEKLVLMQNDHNSERFTFELPRFIEGHDMSLCNVVEVHYNNVDASRRYMNSDVYPVTDIKVVSSEEGEEKDTVTGSWLISKNATTFNGSLEFIVRFANITKQGIIEYQWFSDIYSLIKIEKGIYNVDVVTNFDDKDLLAAWKKEIMDAVIKQAVGILDEANGTLIELNKKISETNFSINFEDGTLEYESPNYKFKINIETGNLEWEVI